MENISLQNNHIDTSNQDTELLIKKTVEDSLLALYKLQLIYSKIDKIRIIRGELPLEVRDLEDACSGIQTRIEKFQDAINDLNIEIEEKIALMKRSNMMVVKYKEQLDNVKNNREYDALNKEIEYQNLEVQLCEKRIKEFNAKIVEKKEETATLQNELNLLNNELSVKKSELDNIIAETEKDEIIMLEKTKEFEQNIESRLLNAFSRIRNNMRNGLAVVKIERDACGGCFSKISPQRQLDIRMHKKIIVCEFCGRILVDNEIAEESTKILNLD
ncbi:MAG: C4-type zinc ribbon domain-containing protein [Bacteroidales bacterium]|nr:C4-type zinc ribbon domain-containing protein [Bacteroidales bacterium]MDD4209110.1 C4-type zinc ribbon domain-containing protein [Bacteroidales bacterium]